MDEKELILLSNTLPMINRYQLGDQSYYIRKIPSFSYRNQQMGSWLSDWLGINIDFAKELANALDAIREGLNHIFNEIGKLFENIDWPHILRELENLGHSIGHLLVEINPVHLVWQGLSTCPLTEHMARELDKLTGGAITSIHNISTLPARAMAGQGISEEELIQDALFAAKVAAVVITGGGAAAIISATADQMKQGTLGETELGRAVLSVATVAGIAYATGGAVFDAAKKETIRQAMGAAKSEIIKHSPLAQTQFGRSLIETAFAGTTAELTGGSFVDAAKSTAKGQAALASAQEISKKSGLPISQGMVESLMNAGYPPDTSKIDFSKLPSNISPSSFLEAIKKIDFSNPNFLDFKIELSEPKGLLSFTDMPKGVLAFKSEEKLIETKENVDWSKKEVTPIKVLGKDVTLPNPAHPEGMEEIIKFWLKLKNFFRKGKKANYKKRIRLPNNQYLDVYLMEDGTFEYDLGELINYLLLLGLGLGAFLLLGLLTISRED